MNGVKANEKVDGSFAYSGTIYTNDVSLDEWQHIVDDNSNQARAELQSDRISGLESDFMNALVKINGLPVTSGFDGFTFDDLNGLNYQNGARDCIVINMVETETRDKIAVFGDAEDVFILRWDEDEDPSNGYQGQVAFRGGGAIVPMGQ